MKNPLWCIRLNQKHCLLQFIWFYKLSWLQILINFPLVEINQAQSLLCNRNILMKAEVWLWIIKQKLMEPSYLRFFNKLIGIRNRREKKLFLILEYSKEFFSQCSITVRYCLFWNFAQSDFYDTIQSLTFNWKYLNTSHFFVLPIFKYNLLFCKDTAVL